MMAQADKILAELSMLGLTERLALVDFEVHRLREQLAQNHTEAVWHGRTVQELAELQGVQAAQDLSHLRADFWPEEETVDDFVATVRQWRDIGRAT